MPDPDLWTVFLAVAPDDVDAIRQGAPRAILGERHGVITEILPDGEDGATELAVDVVAVSQDEAIKEATRLYIEAAIAGGIERGGTSVIGVRSPIFRDPVVALMDEAKALLAQGRHDWAIIRACTACELFTKRALPRVFSSRFGEPRALAAGRQCRNLNDRRHRDVLLASIGQTPTSQPWWSDYETLIQRRNGVVHEGLSVTHDHAAVSVAAAEQFVEWLRLLWVAADLDD